MHPSVGDPGRRAAEGGSQTRQDTCGVMPFPRIVRDGPGHRPKGRPASAGLGRRGG